MATCRDIVSRAYRRSGISGVGRDLTAAQAEEGMHELSDLYIELVAQGVFGRFNDVLLTEATYTAREQDRIVVNSSDDVDISLPDVITQAFTFNPYLNGGWNQVGPVSACYDYGFMQSIQPRPPIDGSVVLIVSICNNCQTTYIYDGSAARWQLITDLTLNDNAPLSLRYSNTLRDTLAKRLADSYGQPISTELQADAARGLISLTHRYDRPRIATVGSYF